MKILFINQFFWPDSAATSQLLGDLTRDLVARGHKVDVICGGTYAATDRTDAPNVAVHRVNGIGFSRGVLGRVSSYLSFYIGATWRALTVAQPDVIVTLTTPPLLSVVGALVHRLRGSRFYIWEMDMYPDVAVDLGYIGSGSLLHKVTASLADWARSQADGIVALGECMRARLEARGVERAAITVVHNWADSGQIRVLPRQPDTSKLEIVYSGNLGLAHELDTVTAAMLSLREDTRFSFVFVGGGSRRDELATFIATHDITSGTMRPYVPRSDLSETLGRGDIGLVTQRDDCCGTVVPSKVYGLMAAGRPILFIGPAAATPALIVHSHACGWHITNGDSDSLVRLLRHLLDHPEEVAIAGRNARNALEANYDRSLGTSHIIAVLTGETGLTHNSTSASQLTADPVTSAPS